VQIFSALVAVLFAALFAWTAIRLASQEIKNEFSR
jgi:TRAP-type C4-dicarboxylate transport system permease small subunit